MKQFRKHQHTIIVRCFCDIYDRNLLIVLFIMSLRLGRNIFTCENKIKPLFRHYAFSEPAQSTGQVSTYTVC